MSNSNQNEILLSIPWNILDVCKGISLDIGASMIKIVYVHKDDWVKPENRKKDWTGQVRLISFTRDELDAAFPYIANNAYVMHYGPRTETEIFTTGLGGAQFSKRIRSEITVKNTNIPEFDCFANSFIYLIKNLPRKEILEDIYHPAYERARKDVEKAKSFLNKWKEMSAGVSHLDTSGHKQKSYQQESGEDLDKPLFEVENLFPCLLVLCGSAFGGIKIEKDGSFRMIDGSKRGGRMFLGLGSILTGCKSFEELMDCCAKGETNKVCTTNLHLGEGMEESDEDIYTALTDESVDERTLFSFGQGVGKSINDFKKEDLARTLLETMLLDLVQFTHILCRLNGCNSVFFVGGFVSHQVTREMLTHEWLRRDISSSMFVPARKNKLTEAYFLKHGTHLGAIGAFLNSELNFSKKKEASNEVTAGSSTSTNNE